MSVETTERGYRVRWLDGDKHRSKSFARDERQEALAFDADVKRAKRLGGLPQIRASRKTVTEVGVEWAEARFPSLEPNTWKLYKWLWDAQIEPALGARKLSEVTPASIEKWLSALDTGTTVKRKAAARLNQIFNFAIKSGYVQANPCAVADRPPLPARQPVIPPTPLEVERIRQALFARQRPGDAYMVGVMAYAGLRPQEALGLVWEDVRARTLLVRAPKTKSHRAVDLLGPLAADLAAWKLQSFGVANPRRRRWEATSDGAFGDGRIDRPLRGQPASPSEVIFPSPHGIPWSASAYSNWRKRVWYKVAPKSMNPYALRHLFVSLLLADPEVTRVEAAQQAGHSLEVQDRVYAHILAENRGTMRAEDAIRVARAEVFGAQAEAM